MAATNPFLKFCHFKNAMYTLHTLGWLLPKKKKKEEEERKEQMLVRMGRSLNTGTLLVGDGYVKRSNFCGKEYTAAKNYREFLGSLVVETQHFYCRGHEFNPWSGKKNNPPNNS